MNKVKRFLQSQRGFMLLNVVILTLITAFAAMILLNAAPRVKNYHSTLRLTALHLANEQFAQLESMAAAGIEIGGTYSFLGRTADLTSDNFSAGEPTKFKVTAHVSGSGNLRDVEVTVEWQVGNKKFDLKSERTIRIVQPKT